MYRAVTRNIEITVAPRYVADESAPDDGRWFWSYKIEIVNRGDETVQLRSRHWIITDATGAVQVVRGAGVVGEQPVIAPGGATATPPAARSARPRASWPAPTGWRPRAASTSTSKFRPSPSTCPVPIER